MHYEGYPLQVVSRCKRVDINSTGSGCKYLSNVYQLRPPNLLQAVQMSEKLRSLASMT
jgi:hypothetical protein